MSITLRTSSAFIPGDLVRARKSSMQDAIITEVVKDHLQWVYLCQFLKNPNSNIQQFREQDLVLLSKKKGKFLQKIEDEWRESQRDEWSFDPTLFGFVIHKKNIIDKSISDNSYWTWQAEKTVDFKSGRTKVYVISRITRIIYAIQVLANDEIGHKEISVKTHQIENEVRAFELFDFMGTFDGKTRMI